MAQKMQRIRQYLVGPIGQANVSQVLVVLSLQWRTRMTKILISIFNSLFFFALTVVFTHNWAVASLVAAAVWLVTFFALCLAAMAHTGDDLHVEKDRQLTMQKGFQLISQDTKPKDYLKIPMHR